MITNAFRSLDLFQFEGKPRHIEGPLRSRFGFIGTLILMGVMIFYVVFSTFRFLTDPPQTSVTQSPTGAGRQNMINTCIKIPHITDKTYFGYTFQRIHNNNESVAIEKIDLKVREDPANNQICLPEENLDAYLSNFCKLGQECEYLKFKIWLCGTNDPKNPAYWNESSKCQPFPTLVKTLQSNYVDFIYHTHLGADIVHTAPKVNASAQYFSIFQLNQTKRNPDLLRWWVESSVYQLQHQRDTFSIQYYYGEVPTNEVLEMQIILGSEALLTVENRKTSLDLIGSFGALWGVIFSVLGMVFLKYNEKKFYQRNPQWGKIDPTFKVEEGAQSEIAGEASALIDHQQGNNNNNKTNPKSDASMMAYGDYN